MLGRCLNYLNEQKKLLAKVFWSFHSASRFYLSKGSCRVVKFRIPSQILYSYLDYNIIQTVSDRIEQVANLDIVELDNNLEHIKEHDNEFYMQVRHIIKLAWLIRDLKKNKMRNPFQLIKAGNGKYFVHPGTDRIIVATYIAPIEYIEGFYLWYPELDPKPFVLEYEHSFIRNPLSFMLMFTFSYSFKLRDIELTHDLDVSDRIEGNAVFATAKNCFLKIKDNFKYPFITFFDRIQWEAIEGKLYFKDSIQFVSAQECLLGDIKFVKKNGLWITND